MGNTSQDRRPPPSTYLTSGWLPRMRMTQVLAAENHMHNCSVPLMITLVVECATTQRSPKGISKRKSCHRLCVLITARTTTLIPDSNALSGINGLHHPAVCQAVSDLTTAFLELNQLFVEANSGILPS